MKLVQIQTKTGSPRQVEVPDTWDEALDMLEAAMNRYHDRRGGNIYRLGTCARVALGMFPGLAPDPTTALIGLMHKICEREGAGLVDARETV